METIDILVKNFLKQNYSDLRENQHFSIVDEIILVTILLSRGRDICITEPLSIDFRNYPPFQLSHLPICSHSPPPSNIITILDNTTRNEINTKGFMFLNREKKTMNIYINNRYIEGPEKSYVISFMSYLISQLNQYYSIFFIIHISLLPLESRLNDVIKSLGGCTYDPQEDTDIDYIEYESYIDTFMLYFYLWIIINDPNIELEQIDKYLSYMSFNEQLRLIKSFMFYLVDIIENFSLRLI